MKKILSITFFTLLVIIGSAKAQGKNDFKQGFYLGAGVGPVFSSVDFIPKVTQDLHQGYYGGLSVKYVSEKNLGIMGEINFAQRGWKEKFENNTGFSYDRTLNYIEIPLMTHINFGRKVRFVLNLGPQVSFLIGNSSDMSAALADNVEARKAAAESEDAKANIGVQYNEPQKKFDYGLIGGGGVEFHSGIGVFCLEGRYYFGLGDMFNTRINDDYFSRAANRVIYGKLTYYIPFK